MSPLFRARVGLPEGGCVVETENKLRMLNEEGHLAVALDEYGW